MVVFFSALAWAEVRQALINSTIESYFCGADEAGVESGSARSGCPVASLGRRDDPPSSVYGRGHQAIGAGLLGLG